MTAAAFSRVLDTVLTYGAQELDQHRVAGLAGVVDSTVSRGRKEHNGYGALLLPAPVRFSPEMGLVLACSVGSESVRAALVDANGQLHNPHSAEPRRDQLGLSPDELMQRIRHQVVRVLEDAFDDGELLRPVDGTLPVVAAALALPAPLSRDHRLRGKALTHPDWRPRTDDLDQLPPTLNEHFSVALGAPFEPSTAQVMNDCNAAAVAVAFDRVRVTEPPRKTTDEPKRERTTAMVVRVSGEVGSGMIEIAGDGDDPHVSRFLKSRVMVGTNGLAGELGHLPISKHAIDRINERSSTVAGLKPLNWDAECSCGKPHHLQALVGWQAMGRRLTLPVDDPANTCTAVLAPYLSPTAGDQDQAAARALEDAGRIIGRALTGPVLALDPHSVTFIGALAVGDLMTGLKDARGEWKDAFWTGRQVAFDPPEGGSLFLTLRGAGLALLRAQRHRRLRDIAAGKWDGLAPLLPYSRVHLAAMRAVDGSA